MLEIGHTLILYKIIIHSLEQQEKYITIKEQIKIMFFKKDKKEKRKNKDDISYNMVSIYDPQYADDYIYAAENGYLMPPVIFDESWEQYKEDAGYYKRHPEREAQSMEYIKKCIEREEKYKKGKNLN